MKTKLILPLWVLLSAVLVSAQTPAGKIAFLLGDVSVQRSGAAEWTKAKINMPVFENDAVKTGKSSRCEVELLEDRMLRFDENTQAQLLLPQSDKTQVKAKSGAVWSNVKKLVNRKSSFEVSTSVATAAIRGTVVEMDCNNNKSNYLVLKGAVEISAQGPNGKGTKVSVSAGEQFTFVTDMDQYMKDQEEALKNYAEQSQAEFDKFQQEQDQAMDEFQKSQDEKLNAMLEEERKAFTDLGNGTAFAKRKIDEEKLNASDWVKWNRSRDKTLGW